MVCEMAQTGHAGQNWAFATSGGEIVGDLIAGTGNDSVTVHGC